MKTLAAWKSIKRAAGARHGDGVSVCWGRLSQKSSGISTGTGEGGAGLCWLESAVEVKKYAAYGYARVVVWGPVQGSLKRQERGFCVTLKSSAKRRGIPDFRRWMPGSDRRNSRDAAGGRCSLCTHLGGSSPSPGFPRRFSRGMASTGIAARIFLTGGAREGYDLRTASFSTANFTTGKSVAVVSPRRSCVTGWLDAA